MALNGAIDYSDGGERTCLRHPTFRIWQAAFSASLGNRQTNAMVKAIVGVNTETLTINEIYRSVQGESTWAGLPCVFVRLTFCDLRCTYCDTAYAFYKGTKTSLSEIVEQVLGYRCPLVEITGGEPLLQKNVLPLMRELCDHGLTVLIETSGAHDISRIDPRVRRIMDLKTPSSGESHRNRIENIIHLNRGDEVKFVIGSREDYLWAKTQVETFNLAERCGTILFSPVFGKIEPRLIVEWLLADRLPVRFQLQMHKFIWAPETKGV
jgi:7-carboxy-7-deazaguanine synthase